MNFPFLKRLIPAPGARPMPRNPDDRTMADYAALNRADRRKLKRVTGVMLRGNRKPLTHGHTTQA